MLASAADMRRKRGINLVHALNADLPADRQIDACGAQVLAVAATGLMMAQAAQGVDAASRASNALVGRLLAART